MIGYTTNGDTIRGRQLVVRLPQQRRLALPAAQELTDRRNTSDSEEEH